MYLIDLANGISGNDKIVENKKTINSNGKL